MNKIIKPNVSPALPRPLNLILLVEDDASLGEILVETLQHQTFSVQWVTTVKEAKSILSEKKFSLVLLDVGLPDGNGFDLAEWMNKNTPTPILFLTALNSAENRLKGYELGAHEYIPKPFHQKELLIRIQKVLDTKRTTTHHMTVGNAVIDFDKMTVTRENQAPEYLQTRDFKLLKLLIDRAPKAVSRDEILNQLWGEDQFPTQRTIDNSIVRLRQSLGTQGAAAIRSVRGLGYQWNTE